VGVNNAQHLLRFFWVLVLLGGVNMSNAQSQVVTAEPLSQAEIEAFVADWYHQLDIHAPPEQLVAQV
jgi:hypothetical protein